MICAVKGKGGGEEGRAVKGLTKLGSGKKEERERERERERESQRAATFYRRRRRQSKRAPD